MYPILFQKLLYPLYESGLRRRNTLKYGRELESSQWLSEDELRHRQWQALKRLIEHAYQYTPYYRQVFDKLDAKPADIKTDADFRRIPVCTREDIVAHNKEMVAANFSDRIMPKSTGGSTGVPMQFAIDRNSYEWRTAVAQRGYSWAKCEAGQHTVYLWSVDIGKPTVMRRWKTELYHRFFNRKMFNLFDLTESEMRRCIQYINAHRPTGIVSYVTALVKFARFVETNKIECLPVPSVITGAEKLYPDQRELIERVLQTKVFNTYGCREFMLIGAECERHEGLHLSIDNLYVEALTDSGQVAPAGQAGNIVVTDLHNYGMPFIRYRSGDLVIPSDKKCSCGRGLPLIEDVEGRKADEILATSGKTLPGVFFAHLMKEFTEIEKYQIIQTQKDQLIVKLVCSHELAPERLEFCKNEIHRVVGPDMHLDFRFLDEIPLNASGKFRITISEISTG